MTLQLSHFVGMALALVSHSQFALSVLSIGQGSLVLKNDLQSALRFARDVIGRVTPDRSDLVLGQHRGYGAAD